jgi:hypothetical protein
MRRVISEDGLKQPTIYNNHNWLNRRRIKLMRYSCLQENRIKSKENSKMKMGVRLMKKLKVRRWLIRNSNNSNNRL